MQPERTAITLSRGSEPERSTPPFSLLTPSGASCPGLSRREFIGTAIVATAAAALSRARESPGWKIGCYTRPWAQFDYHLAFDGIADKLALIHGRPLAHQWCIGRKQPAGRQRGGGLEKGSSGTHARLLLIQHKISVLAVPTPFDIDCLCD